MNTPNWPIYGDDGQSVTVTATSAAVALTAAGASGASDVMIDNPGPNDVWVKAGGAGAVASLASVRVPAYSLQPFAKGAGNTHLALRCAPTLTQAVVIHVGEGQ